MCFCILVMKQSVCEDRLQQWQEKVRQSGQRNGNNGNEPKVRILLLPRDFIIHIHGFGTQRCIVLSFNSIITQDCAARL